MRLKISHITTYQFDQPVSYGLQQLRLTPKICAGQNVVSWSIDVEGGQIETAFADQYENQVSLISYATEAGEISARSEGVIDTTDTGGVIGKHRGYTPLWLYTRSTDLTRMGPNVRRLGKGLKDAYDTDLEILHALSARIIEHVPYQIGETDSVTTADAAIENGRGVCQDHAHIFLAAARAMDFPARYVSGYLMMDAQESQEASHAWAEAHIDGLGWVGFDVSNGISPDERYVRIATGLDYKEAAPVSGIRYGQSNETLQVEITVQQQ